MAFSTTITNINIGKDINKFQRVVLAFDRLLAACEKQKINIELWIEQDKPISFDKRPYDRKAIPDKVQIFVWNRDGGKCVKCGSQENLEFDHIIPLSKGGSNTARNIQLLCESCNRKK